MVNGFFLGGVAEGMQDYDKRAIDRERLAADTGLRTRGLDIQDRAQTLSEKTAARVAQQESLARTDKAIADTMAIVTETVKQSVAAGRDPATIQKAVAPLVDSVKRLGAKAGQDPSIYDAQVSALITNPTAVEVGAVKGGTEAAAKIAEQKALEAGGYQDPNNGFKSKKDKVEVENSLRDDYLKQASDYIKIRDAKNRIDSIEKTGAGDVALVFQYMKILDPGSTVREGEFATAANASGIPEAIRAKLNAAIGSGKLSDESRKQILSQADKLYQAQSAQHDKLTNSFANIAKRQGLNIDNVVVDLSPNARPITGTTPGGLKFSVKPK